MVSTVACHFGGFFGFLGWPILRRRRIAITSRATPIAIFTARDAREGAVFGLGGLLPVASTVTVTTIARDTSHPNTNAAPLRTPRLEGSTTRNAIRGSGSRAIAIPIRTRLSTTAVPYLARQEDRRASILAGRSLGVLTPGRVVSGGSRAGPWLRSTTTLPLGLTWQLSSSGTVSCTTFRA